MNNKRTTRKKKIELLLLTTAVAASAVLGATYAWRSVSQKALNEARNSLNPGARLHDDFNGINFSSTQTADNGTTDRKVKYVYVENFTDAQKQTNVYARIRLDEYLETGTGAGKSSKDAAKSAKPLVMGTTIEDKDGWTPYKWDGNSIFRKYVSLSTGGDTVYMPTFNKDQDSLEADMNGTLAGLDKNIETETDDYSDYVKYTYDAANPANTSTVADIEIYDAQRDGLDKVQEAGLDVETIIAAVKDPTTGKFNVLPNASSITIDGMSYTVTKMEPDNIQTSADITAIYVDLDPTTTGATPQADIILKTAEHTAQMTLKTDDTKSDPATPGILSMDDWNALSLEEKVGKFWVYDSEGWLYWAEPIAPSTATGCLLNAISINDTTTEGKKLQGTEYYYGLNVVAQFATAGDWGEAADKTGFYKDGLTPEGENLLNTITARENPDTAYQVDISLQSAGQTVAPGSSVQLQATVGNLQTGQEEAVDPTQIKWSIDWASSQSAEEKSSRAVTVKETAIDEDGLLTIAENETAKTFVIVATYNYDLSDTKKTVEGRLTIHVDGEINYPITIEPAATTEVMKGTSVTFTATAQKQIGSDAASSTSDGKFTWSVVDAETGNALTSKTTIDQNGTLTIDLAETAKALKIIAVYTVDYVDENEVSQGSKQWTAEKTITISDCTYTMADISAVGKAEPGKTIQYSTTVTRMNGTSAIGSTISSGTGSGITWTLEGGNTDAATTIDPQTGVLTIGNNETNANLTVKASFRDPLNTNANATANVEKTISPGTILTTEYTVTVIAGSTNVIKGESTTLKAVVRPANGTASASAKTIENPDVEWTLSTNSSSGLGSVTKDSDGSSVPLNIGLNETASNITVTATYKKDGTVPNQTKGTAAVTVGDYGLELTLTPGSVTSLSQQGTQVFAATLKKVAGNSKTDLTVNDGDITWEVSGTADKAAGTAMSGNGVIGTLTIGKYEKNSALNVKATYIKYGKTATQSVTVRGVNAATYTMADLTQSSGSALPTSGTLTPGQSITFKTSVTRTDVKTETITSGISYTLEGTSDSSTTFQDHGNGTATLKLGANEKADNLVVKASYQDAKAGASFTKRYSVGSIATTKYTLEKTQDYSAALVQGDDVTYTVKVKKANGTDAGNYVENPNITWTLSGNKATTTKTDVTATDATEKKRKLTIGADETGTVKLTASYAGADDLVLYNAAIQKLTYQVSLSGGSAKIVQEDTGSAYTVTVTKKNGRNANAKVALDSSNLVWNVATPGNSATKITDRTYVSGTATAKLTVAETESASSVKVSASYIDANNGNAKTTSSASTVTIEASQYEIASFNIEAAKLKPGESTKATLKVNKTNGTGAPKQVTLGKFEIKTKEGEAGMTLTPTYEAVNGKTVTGTEKTLTIETKTDEQIAAANAQTGTRVTIGDLEFWKIYEGTEKDTGKKVALLWQVEPEEGFSGKAFGTSCKWGSSAAKSYLESTYLTDHSKIKELVTNGLIPKVTNYQRTDPADESSIVSSADTVFLLSEADLWAQTSYYYSGWHYETPDVKEYTTYGVTGSGTQLLTDLSNKTTIMSHTDKDLITWTWLRSSRLDTNYVTELRYDGVESYISYSYTNAAYGLRPAFWIYL